MPDRHNNPITNGPPGATPGPEQRVGHILTHQHLDTDALSAFIDNRLEGELGLAAAGHIAACSDCRRELAELRATVSLLHSLPQYQPRRTFALGPEYAHPVRTSRFARLLPLLPRLQAATVACLLLLLVVGAGDVLTQIGDDSDNGATTSSEPEQSGGNAAFDAGGGGGQPGAGMIAGDGTGGEAGGARRLEGSESKPGADTGSGSQSDETALVEAPPPAGDAPVEGFSEAPPAEDAELDSAGDADSISAASGPENSDSAAASGADEAAEESLGEAPAAADDAEAAESAAAGGNAAARDSAAGGAAAAAHADTVSGESSSGGQGSAALPPPATDAGGSILVPTIGISTEAPEQAGQGDVAQADASGSAAPGRQSGSASDSGISNWRLIEIVLGVVLVALGVLVVFLHRLNSRARKIGFIR